ncbi:hypothetical protein D9615_009365 [Tricholomella constricta]|uniref:Uncharacterized protein n=1 Tax=Tricholomella constricta TaxID=117010 RepID=A0A8H5H2Z8_9AGAR|nr:hypothetical protein D9615_009365 [Tricholomella constricta]
MDGQKTTREKLEVEDEEARLQRIQSTLEKLNASSFTPATAPPSLNLPAERPKPHFVPPSDLLSRVQAFLPELEASNAVLQQRLQDDPRSVDIENVEDGAEQYIEMNLGLGLFEQRGSHATASGNNESMSSSSDSGSNSDSDSADDSSAEESDSDGSRS